MGFFNGTIQAQAEGRRPHAAILTDHDFNEGHVYNWTGLADLDLDGHTWVGKGDIASIGALVFGADDDAQPIRMTLSGVKPEYVTEARSAARVRGRSQQIYLQFFDADTLQPLDTKLLLADNYMDVMSYGGVGTASRTITLSSEGVWTGRNTAEHANFSDADQQALFPGDEGCKFVAELTGIRMDWPNFEFTG